MIENQRLKQKILKIYNDSKQCFGVYKIQIRLKAEYGIQISVGRVYRLMKAMDLPKPCTRKPHGKRKPTKDEYISDNKLNRQFDPDEPNTAWVSDFTYIKVLGGFLYVCIIIDLFSRSLIAWKVSAKHNASLVCETIRQAWEKRGRPRNVQLHSDRGAEYTSADCKRLLDKFKFIQSMSNPGTPYDNAVAESFFRYLKEERLNRRKFADKQDLEMTMQEYSTFYNARRPHSANNGLTPSEAEREYWKLAGKQAALHNISNRQS